MSTAGEHSEARIRRRRRLGPGAGVARGRRMAADVADYATGGAVVIHCPMRDGTR
ncbi:hypothetical protein ACWD4F_34210 [Streptomyces aureus]